MSGHKQTFVSISESELRRLREDQIRFHSLNSDLPSRLAEIRNESLEEIERLNNSFQADFLELNDEIDDIRDQLNNLISDNEKKVKIARNFITENLTKLMNKIETTEHERFEKGKLNSIVRDINDAINNLNTGMPEAALSRAQDSFIKLSDLSKRVHNKQKTFYSLYEEACSFCKELLLEAQIGSKFSIQFLESETNDLFDADYWSNGELSKYIHELNLLKDRINSGRNTLSIEEIIVISEKLSELKKNQELLKIIENSKDNLISSQIRTNLADSVASALYKEGFKVIDSLYEGEDQRNAFVIKMENVTGSEIITVITPIVGDGCQNSISIHSYDSNFVDENTLRQRAIEVTNMLKDQGLDVSPARKVGEADISYQDIELLKKGKSVKKMKR